MREFWILVGVGQIPSGGGVDIMKLHATWKGRENVPAIAPLTPSFRPSIAERNPRNNRDPVIALLPRDELMHVPELTKPLRRKKLVDAFDLLQTKDVRLMLPENPQDGPNPKPHRVDIPADNPHDDDNIT